MSYEGREQHICKAGHYYETECSYSFEDIGRSKCHCGQESAWFNMVDDTNCDAVGFIPESRFEVLTQEESETCNLGHKHVTKEATYKIPTQEQLVIWRHYWDDQKGMYIPLSKLAV